MGDYVNLGELNPSTRYALVEEYGPSRHYDEWLRNQIEPHWLAWLVILLKGEPDDEKLFPSGKWATIQRLEAMLEKAANSERQVQ